MTAPQDAIRARRRLTNKLIAASRGLLHKVGFREEGYARQYLRINGSWQDHVLYALLRGDLRNGAGAHYCLGVSGHGYGVCGRDANNNVVAGNKTEAVTTGMTFDF